MGKYDDVESVDDPLLEGFTLDARKMFVADALKKRQQREEETVTIQQWAEYIGQRILDIVAEKVAAKPKVIIFDPSESLKKVVNELSAGLRAEMAEIRRELGPRQKGEVIDLPMLPKRRAS